MTEYDPYWDDPKDFWIIRKPRFLRRTKPIKYDPLPQSEFTEMLQQLRGLGRTHVKIEWMEDQLRPRLTDGT